MLLKNTRKIINKGIGFAMKALPVIVPALLVISTNSTASPINGQPTPPASIKKYRKF
ncbi:MAG: hypothetical protein HFE49_04655 [Clostridia bacterium]|nr:hypothetical protein [Clostridia bacterium]